MTHNFHSVAFLLYSQKVICACVCLICITDFRENEVFEMATFIWSVYHLMEGCEMVGQA